MTRRDIIDKIGEYMEEINPDSTNVEQALTDLDMSPHDRLVNYDALTHKLKRFAAELERMRQWVR